MPKSMSIQRVIHRCEGEGNAIAEVSTGWSLIGEATLMAMEISDGLWATLLIEEPSLRPWTSETTPHNRAERGFIDDSTSEAISFPR